MLLIILTIFSLLTRNVHDVQDVGFVQIYIMKA